MKLPKVLRDLITTPGPSGYEQAPAAVFREAAKAFADISFDTVGSTVARVKGKGDGPHLAVIGHIDEIGLMVHHIDDDGFLWVTNVGGWDVPILTGQRAQIITNKGATSAVIGRKPIHLIEPEDRKKAPELKQLYLDIGAKDGDEARKLVRIGDVAVIASEPLELLNDRVASRSFDNRIGCYVAYEAARLVAEAGGGVGDISAVAAVQEEITFAGSTTTAYSLKPDIAIVVDVTHATDVPGVEEKQLGSHRFGSGPVVERGSTLDPQVFELLYETAQAEEIPFTVAASGKATGTDADAVHISRGGVPTGVISVPLRYMHSPVETVQLDDIENSARLIAAFALRLPADVSFLR